MWLLFLQPDTLLECCKLGAGDVAVGAFFEVAQFDVHDTDARELEHLIALGGAHTADLMLFAFVQCDMKNCFSTTARFCRFCLVGLDQDTAFEVADE